MPLITSSPCANSSSSVMYSSTKVAAGIFFLAYLGEWGGRGRRRSESAVMAVHMGAGVVVVVAEVVVAVVAAAAAAAAVVVVVEVVSSSG